MAAQFERVSKYANDAQLELPRRKTVGSGGYDFVAAEDVIIYPYHYLLEMMRNNADYRPYTIQELENFTKVPPCRPTLVPTGVKVKLDPGTILMLSLRSSIPLKTWLVLANSVGIIDSDYYNNPSNEGHIFFQLINFGPVPIIIKKGDRIGQGTILSYQTAEEKEKITTLRTGGFGSTGA